MGWIDFILNVAGLLLWLNWRSMGFAPVPASAKNPLLRTLKRPEVRRGKRWFYLIGLGALLLFRPVIYRHVGSALDWTPHLQLNVLSLPFRSDLPDRMLLGIVLATTMVETGCSDDDNDDVGDSCSTESLPLIDGAAGPVLTEVILECQGDNLNVLATLTDPEGDADLLGVIQTITLFGREDCEGDPNFEVMDDVAGSGLEESFGIVLTRGANTELFDQICGLTEWPVEVNLHDASGHQTFGRVMARVRTDGGG